MTYSPVANLAGSRTCARPGVGRRRAGRSASTHDERQRLRCPSRPTMPSSPPVPPRARAPRLRVDRSPRSRGGGFAGQGRDGRRSSSCIVIVRSRILAPVIDPTGRRHPDGFNPKAHRQRGRATASAPRAASASTTRSASSPAPVATCSRGCSTASRISLLIALSATTITVRARCHRRHHRGLLARLAGHGAGPADGRRPGLPADPDPAGPVQRPHPAPAGDVPPSANVARVTLPDPGAEPLRLALPRPHRARPGAQPARARVRRVRGRRWARAPPASCSARSCPTCGRRSSSTPRCCCPTYIAAEATLSFLGVGLVPPTPSWGAMLADSVRYFRVGPGLPVHSRHLPVLRGAGVQPARRRGARRAGPAGRSRMTIASEERRTC